MVGHVMEVPKGRHHPGTRKMDVLRVFDGAPEVLSVEELVAEHMQTGMPTLGLTPYSQQTHPAPRKNPSEYFIHFARGQGLLLQYARN